MSDNRTDAPAGIQDGDPIATAAVLAEPVRRALYEHVAGRDEPVDRDEAAEATGIGRPLAAFHLDRLAAAGLLEVEYRRRSGRSGPGAGRPAKFYRRTRGLSVELSLPARRYRMAAEIFAEGLDRGPDDHVRDAVREAARDRGAALSVAPRGDERSMGAADEPSTRAAKPRSRRAARRTLLAVLEREGFEPTDDGREIRLRNCPFDDLVADHRDLTCSMNLALLEGLADGVGEAGMRAVARPVDGSCCVRFEPA
jgi:predicted ArsR family transcriptional regulator